VPHGGDLNYAGIARLKPGVTIERGRAELAAAEKAMDSAIGGEDWHVAPVMMPLQQKNDRRHTAEPDRADGSRGRGAAGAVA